MGATKRLSFLLLLLPFLCFASVAALGTSPSSSTSPTPTPIPTPAPWPHQFHSLLYVNYSGSLSLIDLWYDWPNGRNFNIIRAQLDGDSEVLYDLEWNNGTSYLYTLGGPAPHCQTLYPGVGILRPNWLDGAEYLGQETVDGFLCNVWKKVDFIWYYEDVVTKRPVHWRFYTGRSIHVMTFEVGAAMGNEQWQAPAYCFEKETTEKGKGLLGGTIAIGLPETLGFSRKLVLPK